MKKILIFLVAVLSIGCTKSEENQRSWLSYFSKPAPLYEQSPSAGKPKVAALSLVGDFDIAQAMFQLTSMAKDKEISGILINIDCNGGSAAQFSALHDLIKKICLKKPVVALIIGSAWSAGYLIASATNYIIASKCSSIGQIGVALELAKYKEAKTTGNIEAKLEVELFGEGQYKTIFNPYHTLSDADRAYIKSEMGKTYNLFLNLVAENRKIDLKDSKEWADAKIHLAADALRLGLIDEIGTIFEAETKLLELMRAKNPDVLYCDDIEYLFYNVSKVSDAN